MKTKTTTKQRKQIREFKATECDLKDEFGSVLSDLDVLDEMELAECLYGEEE